MSEFSKYGIQNIDAIGNRPRGHWILNEPDDEWPEIPFGTLVVKTRDGASNPMCFNTIKHPNCFDTKEDSFDCTYRYYFFKPNEVKP